jgi:hypothetical protein
MGQGLLVIKHRAKIARRTSHGNVRLPDQRTFAEPVGMSQRCQQRTSEQRFSSYKENALDMFSYLAK